jgi:hypothetical protein
MREKLSKLKDLLKVHRTSGYNYKRFGPNYDGGYIMVDDLKSDDYLITAGVGDGIVWSQNPEAEREMSFSMMGVDVYEISPQAEDLKLHNYRYFQQALGSDFGFKEMLSNAPKANDYILKIDVEGFEIDMLNNVVDELKNFRQIALEFHFFVKGSHIDYLDIDQITRALEKLNETHNLVVITPNNYLSATNVEGSLFPVAIECLYLRKDSYNFISFDRPEDLKFACIPDKPSIELFYDALPSPYKNWEEAVKARQEQIKE